MATALPKQPATDRAELLRILDLPPAEFRAARTKMTDVEREELRRVWLEDSAQAIASSNEYVDKHGLPLAKYRPY